MPPIAIEKHKGIRQKSRDHAYSKATPGPRDAAGDHLNAPLISKPAADHSEVLPAMRTIADTRERILATCIALFNRDGASRVSMNGIAAAMDISPGHLTYHFPRRADIDAALADMVERIVLKRISSFHAYSDPVSLSAGLIEILSALWDFRFFFDRVFAARADQSLNKTVLKLQRSAIKRIENSLAEAAAAGWMRPIRAPNSMNWVARNLWSLWTAGIRAQSRRSLDDASLRMLAVREGALSHFSMLEPYTSPAFAVEWYSAIRRLTATRVKLES